MTPVTHIILPKIQKLRRAVRLVSTEMLHPVQKVVALVATDDNYSGMLALGFCMTDPLQP